MKTFNQRNRVDVRTFVREDLHFADFADFVDMMLIKDAIDKQWRGINQILEQAGRKKRNNPAYSLVPRGAGGKTFDPTNFGANLRAAVGPLNYAPLKGIAEPQEAFTFA